MDVFVRTVKSRATISKRVQYYILKKSKKGRKELMGIESVLSVGRRGTINEHVLQLILRPQKAEKNVWRCEERACAESVDCLATMLELVNLVKFEVNLQCL